MRFSDRFSSTFGRLFSRRNLTAWVTLILSLFIVFFMVYKLLSNQHEAAEQQFDLLTEQLSRQIHTRMVDHEKILLAAAGLMDASNKVTRQDWKRFTDRLQLSDRYPGIQGVGFSKILRPDEITELEVQIRNEGFSDFKVHPQDERHWRSAIIYLEPFSGRNLAAFGFDMFSEARRSKAMLAAATSGESRLTDRLTLVQETEGKVQAGLLMYVPVYQHGMPISNPQERLKALRGFVYSPYRMNDLMTGILGSALRSQDFEIYAGEQVDPERLLFNSHESLPQHSEPTDRSLQLDLYGQTWTLVFHRDPAFTASFEQGHNLLLWLGICISLLLFFLVSSLSQRGEQARSIARQMTEQLRQKKEALRRSEERLELAIKGSNDGLWDLDLETDKLFASPRATEMLGYSKNAPAPDNWHALIHPDSLQNTLAAIEQLLKSRRTHINAECLLLHRQGFSVPVLLRGYILRNEHGEATRISGTSMDLTERKRVDRMKVEFVSTVSHELRTPLTSIAGALGLVNGGALGEVPATMKQMLDIAHQNSLRLSHLINDLLDMDKLVAGKMNFNLQNIDLSKQIDDAISSNQSYADQHDVRLSKQTCEPIAVRADEMRVQQVLANFLSNAIKFSPAGSQVDVSCERRDQRMRISVTDSGCGIDPKFHEQIFQKFSQADSTDSRQKGGTGLGLAISKELVERMHGSIGFDSIPGAGSTFWCELPIAQAFREDDQDSDQHTPLLLVVEDEPDIALLLEQMLTSAQYNVRIASSLEEARELLRTHKFDALTLDLRLPDGSGLELLRELRQCAATQALPVVVVTATEHQGQLDFGLSFEAIDWLGKPIDQQHLLNSLSHALRSMPSRPRVLHVEDDADLRAVVAEQGRDLAEFYFAGSLAQARKSLAREHFDMVLLDISLPDGSGLELLDELHAQHPQLPVVVLSANELPAARLGQVHSVLAKSRTDSNHFLGLLSRLLTAKENQDV